CNNDSSQFGVTRLDPTTNKVVANIDIGGGKQYSCDRLVASTDKEVWAVLLDGSQTYDEGLVRIDPATNKVIATIPLPQSMDTPLAADAQGVWAAEPGLGLLRIDPQKNQAVGLLPMTLVAGVALGAGSVWLGLQDGSLVRVTPAS